MSAHSQPPTIGIVGAGQLARMCVPAATELGIELHVLAQQEQESAAQVIPHVAIGSAHDPVALARFGANLDAVTFDHELVAAPALTELARTATSVQPGIQALPFAQNKVLMRQRLEQAGFPVPAWFAVPDLLAAQERIEQFASTHGWPIIVKLSYGGYDGRGVWVVRSAAELIALAEIPLAPGAEWLIEQHLDFTAELAAQVVRGPSGQEAAYPVVETIQRDGICHQVLAPAPSLSAEQEETISAMALAIARELNVTGMLAVELFQVKGAVIINELAMRPHNSGHWSIEGASTSQFQNHLRAVLDLPLGQTQMLAPAAVMINLLGPADTSGKTPSLAAMLAAVGGSVSFHWYGKEVRPGRKVGHVTATGADVAEVRAVAQQAALAWEQLVRDQDQ